MDKTSALTLVRIQHIPSPNRMKQINNKNTKMKTVENKWGVSIEELLRQKYVDENKSIAKIAEELQISYATIVKWLNLAGVYSRRLRIL